MCLFFFKKRGFYCGEIIKSRHLHDFADRALFVAWVNSLGGVAGKEVAVVLQSGGTLEDRNTFFFCNARVDRTLIDDDISVGEDTSNRFTRNRFEELAQI